MKDLTEALAKLGITCVIVASVTANVTLYRQVKVLQQVEAADLQALQQTYASGLEAGAEAAQEKAAASLPQQCTAWWFGNDKATIKLRHQQAKAAYCPGKKSAI